MLLSPQACRVQNGCTVALLLLLLSMIVGEARQIVSYEWSTGLQWLACNLAGIQQKHARCVGAAQLLQAHVLKAYVRHQYT